MVGYCKNSPAPAFIIATESGMLHRLRREIPSKTFIAGPTDWRRLASKMGVNEVLRIDADGRIELTRAMAARLEWPDAPPPLRLVD